MNEIEVVALPNGIDGFLSELRPATQRKWNYETHKDEIDNSVETLEKVKVKFELVKESLREVYSFGESVQRGTPKFCLALFRIFNNLNYVEDSSEKELFYGSNLKFKPSLAWYGSQSGFNKIIGYLGLSATTAYRYKDLGNFVDGETQDFYTEFQGYSISLLSEIWAYATKNFKTSLTSLKALSKLIPADTTIEDMRLYCKAMKELECYGGGLFGDYTYKQRSELENKRVSSVLKVYKELLQKAETKKLEATMSGVTEVVKTDKSVKVLPAADEITVKKEHYQKLSELAERSMKIGLCAGCKHSGTNLNKCRCCRRYENLKDLFETK